MSGYVAPVAELLKSRQGVFSNSPAADAIGPRCFNLGGNGRRYQRHAWSLNVRHFPSITVRGRLTLAARQDGKT
jgi:hypothetical protein